MPEIVFEEDQPSIEQEIIENVVANVKSEENKEDENLKIENFKEIVFHDIDKPKEGYPEVQLVNDTVNTTGLNDDLTQEDLAEIDKIMANIKIEQDIDKNLDEDVIKVQFQNYAVLSFIGPNLTAKSDINGFRIMGLFNTIENASNHISNFTEKELAYDTGIVEMYKFVPSYPSLEQETQEDLDEMMNASVIAYKKERERAHQIYVYRKDKLMKNKNRIIEKPLEDEQKKKELEDSLKIDPKKSKKTDKSQKKIIPLVKNANVKNNRNDSNVKVLSNVVDSKVHNQNYVAICYVSPTGSNKRIPMKIKGGFNTYDDCQKHCNELMEIDDTYDIVVSDMYSWIPSDPDISNLEFVYSNRELNELDNAHKEENRKAQKQHIERARTAAIEENKLATLPTIDETTATETAIAVPREENVENVEITEKTEKMSNKVVKLPARFKNCVIADDFSIHEKDGNTDPETILKNLERDIERVKN